MKKVKHDPEQSFPIYPTLKIYEVAETRSKFIGSLLRIGNDDGLIDIEIAEFLYKHGILHGYELATKEKQNESKNKS